MHIAPQYLRGVIVSGFQNGTMPHDTPLFPVLARLLKITDAETELIQQVSKPPARWTATAWGSSPHAQASSAASRVVDGCRPRMALACDMGVDALKACSLACSAGPH